MLLHPIDHDPRRWEASSSSHIRRRPILFRFLIKQVNTVRLGTFGKWTSFSPGLSQGGAQNRDKSKKAVAESRWRRVARLF